MTLSFLKPLLVTYFFNLVAFQSIDWQDFVVVETIELSAADKELELPSPLSIREVRNLSIAQKKMATLLEEEEVEEDQQMHDNEVDQQSKEDEVENELRGKEIKQSIMSAPEGMKIKANYVPKCKCHYEFTKIILLSNNVLKL